MSQIDSHRPEHIPNGMPRLLTLGLLLLGGTAVAQDYPPPPGAYTLEGFLPPWAEAAPATPGPAPDLPLSNAAADDGEIDAATLFGSGSPRRPAKPDLPPRGKDPVYPRAANHAGRFDASAPALNSTPPASDFSMDFSSRNDPRPAPQARYRAPQSATYPGYTDYPPGYPEAYPGPYPNPYAAPEPGYGGSTYEPPYQAAPVLNDYPDQRVQPTPYAAGWAGDHQAPVFAPQTPSAGEIFGDTQGTDYPSYSAGAPPTSHGPGNDAVLFRPTDLVPDN